MNPRRRPLRLGLTGGIGSGKSTVGGMFAALGGSLIDADQLARDVTGPQGAAMNAIRATFGADFVDASGALDRARMRALVFSHPEARAQLEGIVHPLVTLHSNAKAQQAADQGHALIVFDIPLLAESGGGPAGSMRSWWWIALKNLRSSGSCNAAACRERWCKASSPRRQAARRGAPWQMP